jgi:hypothetical protein
MGLSLPAGWPLVLNELNYNIHIAVSGNVALAYSAQNPRDKYRINEKCKQPINYV